MSLQEDLCREMGEHLKGLGRNTPKPPTQLELLSQIVKQLENLHKLLEKALTR